VAANGNVKVSWVPAIANQAAPTAAELNATGAIDISCGIVGSGFTPGSDQTTSQDVRLCSTQVFDVPGDINYTIDDIEVIITPQDVSPTGENKIYDTLATGTTGFIVARWGKPFASTYATADVVDVYHVTLGAWTKQAPERNTKLRAKIKVNVVAPGLEQDASVAA
jgi:hypothetical protein